MSGSLRSRPSKEVAPPNPREMPRVRHRSHLGGSPPNNNHSNSPRLTHNPSPTSTSLTINTQFSGFRDESSNRRTSPGNPDSYHTLASPKLHGRRARSDSLFERSNRSKMVLGGALLVLSFCMVGVWMSSKKAIESGGATRRDGAHSRHYSSGKIRRQREVKAQQNRNRVMEVYQPLPDRRTITKSALRIDGEKKHEEQGHSSFGEHSEDSNNESYDDDDNIGVSVPFLVPSSYVDLPSQDVDMRIWGYASRPRLLHCDFQPLNTEQRNRNVNEATLNAVKSLPTHETKQLLPSERYVTSYPDDDKHLERIREVRKNSKKYRVHEAEPFESDTCKAKHKWQIGAFPNCNNLHEFELGELTHMHGRAMRQALNAKDGEGDEQVKYWSHGYWRDVWLLSKAVAAGKAEEITVLKTLRMTHDFTDRNYDRHRKDALASERLSKSPNVVDIYAYCSNSAIFEYGDAGDIDSKIWPYDKKVKKHYVAELSSLEMIDLAYQVARAIADIHDVEDDGIASIAHTDITPTQFILINGRYKVNDFNRCRFIRVNTTDNSSCGFTVGANPGKFRSPEEYEYKEENEMVDIYSMGNIFYAIISGDMPFENDKEKEAQKKIKNGQRPIIPEAISKSDDIAIKTIVSAVERCWKHDPKERPSASTIRDELKRVMDKMTSNDGSATNHSKL
ncbi:hypothetical protein ACHAW6_013180 [Cyclotella cf. meneghiniana]